MNQKSPQTSHTPLEGSEMDNPGVRLPPPLVYLAAILIGASIDRYVPIRFLPASLTGWLGGAVCLLALTLTSLSIREFGKAKTTIRPDRPASALVSAGPFHYSRNPMYVALSTLQIGIGIWLNSVWIVVLLAPVLVWVRWRVIAREEHFLVVKFGKAYMDYQAKVRRWF